MPEQHRKLTTIGPPSRAPEQPGFAERRKSPRYSFTATAEVVEPQSSTRITGRTADIAQGGCYVDTMSPFPVGTQVVLRLTQGTKSFQCQATVVYALVGMGMGLAFTRAAPEQTRVLQEWIAELSGQPLTQTALQPIAEPASPPGGHRLPPAAPQAASPGAAPAVPDAEEPEEKNARYVLNQLISLLMRKRILTEKEANALLRELFR